MIARADFLTLALSACLLAGAAVMLIRWIRAGNSPEPPLELRALLLVSLSIAVVDACSMAFAPDARELFVRRFGDLGIPSAIVATAVTTLVVERRSGTRTTIVLVLGALSFLHLLPPTQQLGEGAGSPRAILGVLVPLVWAGVLLSPRVKRYCSSGAAPARALPPHA